MEITLFLYHKEQYLTVDQALETLEPDINLFASRYQIRGMEIEDVKQELRIQLWKKFNRFNPDKAGLRTWAWKVMRNRCTDLNRRADDKLDSDNRYFPDPEERLREDGNDIFKYAQIDENPEEFFRLFFLDTP